MSTKIGRNDPCPCGSGKKAKKCCYGPGVARHVPDPAEPSLPARFTATDDGDDGVPALSHDFPTALAQIEDLFAKLPAGARARLRGSMNELRALEARHEETERASEALEAYRADYEALMDNEEEHLARVSDLYQNALFAPFHFTASDVQRAFESCGYPAASEPLERQRDELEKAALFLADASTRRSLTSRLMSLLPDLVAAGRPLDGWIVQHDAIHTLEEPDELNPFLWNMFIHGFAAWEGDRRSTEEDLLRSLGLDLEALRGMGFSKASELLSAQMNDPQRRQAMEGMIKQAPQAFKDALTANMQSIERAAVKLLNRDDTRDLLLTWDDMEPWLPELQRRFGLLQAKHQSSPSEPVTAAMQEAGAELAMDISIEMAEALFSPERIESLRTEINGLRRTWQEFGDTEAARAAGGALVLLSPDVDPRDSFFLHSLCYQSLSLGIREAAEAEDSDGAPS